jgi:hypothetical protein
LPIPCQGQPLLEDSSWLLELVFALQLNKKDQQNPMQIALFLDELVVVVRQVRAEEQATKDKAKFCSSNSCSQ